MPSLVQLPTELLIQIAAQFDGPSRQQDLSNFALTSRIVRDIAQDVLFTTPCVGHPNRDHKREAFMLARTMIEQPCLATKIRHLAVEVLHPALEGEYSIGSPSAEQAAGFAADKHAVLKACWNFARQSKVDLTNWIEGMEEGLESFYLGACLAFATSLESLNIHVNSGSGSEASRVPQNLFYACHIGQTVNTIPAFAGLTSLTTNCPLPWVLVSLPNLRRLHFRLNEYSAPYDDFPKQPVQLKLSSLIISISEAVLVPYEKLTATANRTFRYFAYLMQHTDKLEHLALRVTREYPFRIYKDVKRDWSMLIFRIPSLENLKSFEIDAAGIRKGPVQHAVYEEMTERLLRMRAAPVKSLKRFPNLRRLVVPQSVIVDEKQVGDQASWETACLPNTLQSIEIIDSTQLLNQWAFHTLNDRRSFSALTRIVVWCDRKGEPVERVDKLCDFDFVWDDMRDAGVALETHGPSERLQWRRHWEDSYLGDVEEL